LNAKNGSRDANKETKGVSHDDLDRRDFLKCMAWAGTGLLWTFVGGVPTSRVFAATPTAADDASFSFVQISDSHIGFSKPANMDPTATLKAAIDKINLSQSKQRADLILHTGDVSHTSQPEQFDTAIQVIKGANVDGVFYIPGEHDTSYDGGASFWEHFGKGTRGGGWYSFDHKGVHFMGLNNVVMLEAFGDIGGQQLEWMKNDVAGLSSSTPIVLFAHVPLWMIYPQWGWGTNDGAQALSLLKRFGSVTVLNGHIHQIVQKIEGNVSFHTAMSTAFPQPAPGTAPHAGPKVMPAGQLESALGVTTVNLVAHNSVLAIVDSSLEQKA
jgi:3',5'-cyclic-AMP phosphodiesterase